ncbi:hypothetical protein HBH70_150790 [Parastagonospora nodorum]|nr:hypothetical protein HBI73_191650 [Parastagonospora nodorum]KAH5095214.1 hypothetical protein HBH72_151480 [Parastagonospora nodorum]KAH5133844.1 hypothetical protein HBH70_150790 [Parastagonospora nodorum]KAH5537089.1 hypothetical protein HBI27_149310 [Parastagonospora nodorum]KAH5594500.1 hypothetical protein HBI24_003860 [Parastagonospora nodorum]
MPRNLMHGFSRKKVEIAKDLKDIIISQLQAVFGFGNNLGSFDVIHLKFNSAFIARAIAYPVNCNGSNGISSWFKVLDGYSTEGVVHALEDLWDEMLAQIGPNFQVCCYKSGRVVGINRFYSYQYRRLGEPQISV